jgi:hypothetical protein
MDSAVLALVIVLVLIVLYVLAHVFLTAMADQPSAAVLNAIDPSGTARISVYTYHGSLVLYVQPVGADVFNSVYTWSGQLLGAPDGGLTGRGDGRLPDWGAASRFVRVVRGSSAA